MADLEQTGIEFVVEGEDAFEGALNDASTSMQTFEDTASDTGSSFDGWQEIVTGALRAVGDAALNMALSAGSAVVGFATDSLQAAIDGQAGMTKLEGAIKRAGDAAPITEQQAKDLAQSLKGLAGGSDEAVVSAESVLLKFQSIGKDTFPKALQASLDLAAVLGTDATSAAEQLGRALGNTEASSRLLKQAGIFLTDQEKEQLKAMNDAGDAAGAQQFILDKLATTTGGAAEQMAGTIGGQWKIFQNTTEDAGKSIAEAFLPVIQTLMDNYLKPLLPIIVDVASFISGQLASAFGGFTGDLSGLQTTLQPVIDAMSELFSTFQEQAPGMQSLAKDLFTFLNEQLGISLPTVIDNLVSIIHSLTEIWRDHGTQIMTIIEVAFKFIFATISGAVTLISGAISVALQVISGAFKFWTAVFSGDWSGAWNIILDTVQGIGDTIVKTISSFVGDATSIITKGMQDAVSKFVMDFTSGIQAAIINGVNGLREHWGDFNEAAVYLMGGIRDGILRGIGWVLDAARSVAQAAVDAMRDVLGISSPSKVMMELVGKPMSQGIGQGILGGMDYINQAVSAVVQVPMLAGQMMGGSVNNNQSSNYNLSVNSSQNSQGIISDFAIMQAMA